MKKILIMSKQLNSGGVEVSLINLLKELSLSKDYEVTLFLEKFNGVYKKDIPLNIKIKEIEFEREYYNFLINFNDGKKIFKGKNLIKFYFIKLIGKTSLIVFKYNKIGRNIIKYKSRKLNEQYDLVIDFHGYGYDLSAYAVYNIECKKRIMFVHDENIKWMKRIKDILKYYDKFFCVSNSCAEIVKENYKELSGKIEIFHNLIDEKKIVRDAQEKINFPIETNKFKILTIGRLEYQKGYDILLEIAEKLKNMGIEYIWYIIGIGSLYKDILKLIKDKKLDDNVVLLGMKKNPYPYLKKSDIYVQPSRHEGYGIAIAEAKCLNKPIIATRLDCIKEQIEDGHNGILCELNSEEFALAIKKLYSDKEFKNNMINNLQKESKKFANDIQKIYDLL